MKHWLLDRFLPMWAKETVLRDNRLLERENRQLQQKIDELEAYVAGVQTGLRAIKRIRIVNGRGEV